MYKSFNIYEEATGKLTGFARCTVEGINDFISVGSSAFFSNTPYSSSDYYVVNGSPIERPEMPVTINSQTLSNIPQNSSIKLSGLISQTIDLGSDTVFEIESELEGKVTIDIEGQFPTKDYKAVMEVTLS